MSSQSSETSSVAGHNLRLDRENYAKTLWDYAFTNACFPRGIRPTDIDFMVEMNKHFLFGEFAQPNKELSKGQEYALNRLARQPNTTVFRVVGFPPNSVGEWEVIGSGRSGTGTDSFLEFLREWVESVDGA